MKKATTILLAASILTAAAITSVFAGVQSIKRYSTSSTGETVYIITCSGGSVAGKYYYRNGQWYSQDGFAAGHRGKSIEWLANYKCR